ncbi:glycoside hydrolase N-terminal domain-containing protein [Lysobacter cavernae]|uniref:Glycoside hydrolase N-terminal domain-containing protein n=1 Tax=Lysobacter cavernae TaxID=1685901 RepID=A0ABV7RP38_9GAMM
MTIDSTRRELLKATTAALALAGFGGVRFASATGSLAAQATAADALTLWYRRPATQWVEALPLGNGRLGAMVWGGGQHERLQLNEDTLYAGGPYDPVSPDALAALAKVRELIFAGRYVEAEALADAAMIARPRKQMPYQPLGDLVLDFLEVSDLGDYRRELDLDCALATTTFESRQVVHRRDAFVSPVDQCLVVRLGVGKPGRLGLRIGLDTPQDGEVVHVGDNEVLLHGRNDAAFGIEGRLRFAMRMRVIAQGGTLRALDDRLELTGADGALLLLTAATSYRRFDDVGGDPASITRVRLDAAANKQYDTLLADHIQEHRRLFRRVQIDLGRGEGAGRPTDERVQAFAQDNDPALAALYHQFGRYLLIASSRPGTQPANLQGIWNDLRQPPWESKYTININTQMNYWPAEPTALGECVEPLAAMVEDLAKTGADAARRMYGARGWVAHHNTDLWRQVAPIDGAKWGLWPMGGAWLCEHLWERWDYGRDRALLARIQPLLKGAAEFFVDTLVEDPRSGELVTNPSLSPENMHPHGSTLCAGPAMDSQILRDLFAHCIEASRILGVDGDFAVQLQALRERLPQDRIGKAGQLQEWREDWDMDVPEIHHRHVSHLYALYPSAQINVRDTPQLAAAAKKSLDIRGDDATGWGLGWRLNLWARLGDGEHAYRILQRLLQPDRTYPNLFDAHPPFQIDGNFGGTAGITQMLLQSWGGSIFLLPALPAAWPRGEVRGLRVRGAASVDLTWRDGLLTRATLRSDAGGDYEIVHRNQTLKVALKRGRSAQFVLRDGALVRA